MGAMVERPRYHLSHSHCILGELVDLLCARLKYHPDERLTTVATDVPEIGGEIAQLAEEMLATAHGDQNIVGVKATKNGDKGEVFPGVTKARALLEFVFA